MRPINDLRSDLAHYAQELDKRRESGIVANVVTALYQAHRQLQRLTPQWHAMPTVEEVRARDGKRWMVKANHGIYVVRLRFQDDEVQFTRPDGMGWSDVPNMYAMGQWWPCDDDGIREASWPTVIREDER